MFLAQGLGPRPPDPAQEGGLNQAAIEALITNKKLNKFKLCNKWDEWKAGGELLLYQANNRINRRNGEAPALTFSVDISPMRVEVREVHPSLTEFVTHLCAVLGGVFTTMGLIDGFFFYSTRALTKKTM